MKPTASILASLCVVFAAIGEADAQSISVGLGLGFPLQTFVEDEVDREFRVAPEPGYYANLVERSNAILSQHFNFSLVLDEYDFLVVFDDLEIRVDVATFGWDESTVTHTSCDPVEVIDDAFDDATVDYVAVTDATCLGDDYDSVSDISELELPSLQIFNIGVGGRARVLDLAGWIIWLSSGVGFTIATFVDPGAEFFLGGSVSAGGGVSFEVSEILTVQLFEARATFVVSEAPDRIQNRLNHEPATGGNVLSALIETYSWVDLQLGLRFAF